MSPLQFLYEHPFLGLERDWLAVNSRGEVGFFSTAGFGPIPKILIDEPSVEETYERIENLPLASGSILVHFSEDDCQDWVTVAERGVFAFDWDPSEKVFRLIARPVVPVLVDVLGDRTLSEFAKKVMVDWSHETKEVSVEPDQTASPA